MTPAKANQGATTIVPVGTGPRPWLITPFEMIGWSLLTKKPHYSEMVVENRFRDLLSLSLAIRLVTLS